MRTNITDAARTAQQTTGRATIREVSDDHLVQEVKQADVHHNETPSDFERWQMVGVTAVPLPQKSTDKNKVGQPKGPAAEALMIYVGGQRSHPVALVDDRRVRPYGMKPGQGAVYAPDGSEQMLHFRQDGTYVVALDGKSVEEPNGTRTRMASLRHVTKDMQSHKIDANNKPDPNYAHHGKAVNTEVRVTAGSIQFYDGATLVGSYDKATQTWVLQSGSSKFTINADKIVGEHNNRVFAVNQTGAQIKIRNIHHATVTQQGLFSDVPWQIAADPMQAV